MDRKKLFSVEDEVALHPEKVKPASQREELPEAPAERDGSSEACYYSSVAFEPGVGQGTSSEYRELLRREQTRYPGAALPVLLSVLSGILGGVFAVPAVFLNGCASWIELFMLVFLGPFTEETLKQSGAIFQLEKMRCSLRYRWQFFLSGALGGAVFSVLENLIYRYVYLADSPPEKLAAVMAFRWTLCTLLHILTTLVSSMGLCKIWQDSLKKERPCRLADAFPWFAAATFIHGLYNFSMLLLDPFNW